MMAPGPTGTGPVALLAGSGELPLLIAERLKASGRETRIIAFRGFACRALRMRADAVLGLLDVGAAVACLDRWHPEAVTLAGGVARPGAAVVIDAFSALRNRAEIAQLMSRGDDNLLRGVLNLLEERGHRVLGVADIAPDLLAADGVLGRTTPSALDAGSIRLGFSLLDQLSPFDIGQAAALRGERVLAVEGPEGTDRTLRRVAAVGRPGLFRRRVRGGVLVKAPKLGQDLRVDLPAIGPRTVVLAARAGLSGIAVRSGASIVIDRDRTIAEADRRGLFVVGVPAAAGPSIAPVEGGAE